KQDIIIIIAATVVFSFMTNNDKVGLLLFSDRIEKFIPPKKGRSHVLWIIRDLLEFKPTGVQTDINQAVRYIQNMMKKQAIVFILSDFMAEDYESALKVMGNKHDLTGIRVYDRRETEMPNLGMVNMRDAETGEFMLVNTGSAAVRQNNATYDRRRRQN